MSFCRLLLAILLVCPCPRYWAEMLEGLQSGAETSDASEQACCHDPLNAPADPCPPDDCKCVDRVFILSSAEGTAVQPLGGVIALIGEIDSALPCEFGVVEVLRQGRCAHTVAAPLRI